MSARTNPRQGQPPGADFRVAVRVRPGAGRTAVGGRYGDADPPVLVVRVSAPAVDGRATEATLAAVAEAFGVRRGDVELITGTLARDKVVLVNVDPVSGRARLDELLGG